MVATKKSVLTTQRSKYAIPHPNNDGTNNKAVAENAFCESWKS